MQQMMADEPGKRRSNLTEGPSQQTKGGPGGMPAQNVQAGTCSPSDEPLVV